MDYPSGRTEHAYDGSGRCMLCGKTREEGGTCTRDPVAISNAVRAVWLAKLREWTLS